MDGIEAEVHGTRNRQILVSSTAALAWIAMRASVIYQVATRMGTSLVLAARMTPVMITSRVDSAKMTFVIMTPRAGCSCNLCVS